MRGRGLRSGYDQATCSCDSWATAVEGKRKAASHLKLPGIIPPLMLVGLMHLVLRKENKVCSGKVVSALKKNQAQGNKRLGKTEAWENLRLWVWKDLLVGLKACCVSICCESCGQKNKKKPAQKWVSFLHSARCQDLFRAENNFLMSAKQRHDPQLVEVISALFVCSSSATLARG